MNQTAMVAIFILLPFLISGAFWASPWLGWPAAVVLGPIWTGTFVLILKGQKK